MISAEVKGEHLLAVDIGGTKIAAALVSSAGQILHRRQVPTSQEGPEAGIAQIAGLLQRIMSEQSLRAADIKAIGIGIPAVLQPESDLIIWAPNLDGWRDVALRPALQALLNLPVTIEYDGHTAVLGEWWRGAGQGYDSCVDLIIGTGIGGGIILDSRLVRGLNRLAGAAGWFALTSEPAAAVPESRSVGFWESLAAGPGIARRAQELLAGYPDSALAGTAGREATARDIFAAARSNDALARRVVAETADLIGIGVANIVSLLNPQIVILGGSVGAQGDLLLPRVREVVSRWAQPISAGAVVITSSILGTDAGLLGAAYAAQQRSQE